MNLKYIFIWAILLRFLIMPITFHPDIKDIHLRVSYLYTEKVFNIYEHLKINEFTKIHAPDFAYPPLTYFTLGSYQFLMQPILGNDFSDWIKNFDEYKYQTPYLFRYLFSLKFIYLVFELLIGLLLLKLVPKDKQRAVLAFWFFNPINLYAIYAIGQFDVIPTFFTVLSLFLWTKQKALLSGLSLGVGIAFKTFPLLLLPLFWLGDTTLKKKILFSICAVLFYLITILPYLGSSAFQKDVLFSGLSTRIFELKLSLGILNISVFVLLYALYLTNTFLKRKIPLYINILITFLLVFAATRFHPQWIIWLMPFLTLAVAEEKLKLRYLFPFFVSYFLYFIFFGDSFLSTGLLSPISSLYLEIPPFTQLIPQNHSGLIKPLTQIVFAASALLIIVKLSYPKKLKDK